MTEEFKCVQSEMWEMDLKLSEDLVTHLERKSEKTGLSISTLILYYITHFILMDCGEEFKAFVEQEKAKEAYREITDIPTPKLPDKDKPGI
jgi:hypothetical protein